LLYLQLAIGNVRVADVAVRLSAVLVSILCVAAYGHVVNDVFDIEADRRAGKPNAMAQRGRGAQASLATTLFVAPFLPALLVPYPGWSIGLLLLNLLLPTIYSIPGTRLKERGVMGLIADVGGSHLLPTLFLLTALGLGGSDSRHFTVVAALWSCALGVKGILNHQVADRENDLASGTSTFATRRDAGQIERWLPRYNLFVEAPVSIGLALTVIDVSPLAAVALGAYTAVELAKYELGFQFALSADPRTIRPTFPFVNDAFYLFWLPLAAAIQLALLRPDWLWLPFLHSALFAGTARVRGRDLRDLALALAHAANRRIRALSHHRGM
jgi:4-hydroxybenzoate polyprenyltransferase